MRTGFGSCHASEGKARARGAVPHLSTLPRRAQRLQRCVLEPMATWQTVQWLAACNLSLCVPRHRLLPLTPCSCTVEVVLEQAASTQFQCRWFPRSMRAASPAPFAGTRWADSRLLDRRRACTRPRCVAAALFLDYTGFMDSVLVTGEQCFVGLFLSGPLHQHAGAAGLPVPRLL